MSDIRCPMCGKSNPADSEICQHCGAQIKPKHFDSSEDDFSSPQDQISWLKDLQDHSEGTDDSEPVDGSSISPADSGGEMPDWLMRIRERSRYENQAAARAAVDHQQDAESRDEKDGPDWMRDLNQTPSDNPEAPRDAEDWLGKLRNVEFPETEKPSQDEDHESVPEIPLEEQVIDRLSALGSESAGAVDDETFAEPAAQSGDEEETFEGDLADWLNKLEADEPAGTVHDQGTTVPGWLNLASTEGETEAGSDQEGENIPDWSNLDRELDQETADEGQTSAWDGSPEQPEAASAGEIPDWLRSLESEIPAQPDAESSETQNEEKPDWLSEIEEEVFETPAAGEEGASEPLDLFEESSPEPAEQTEPDALPDWLSGLEKTSFTQETGDQDEEPAEALFSEERFSDEKDSAPGFESDLEAPVPAEAEPLAGASEGKLSPEMFSDEVGPAETPSIFKGEVEDTEKFAQDAMPPFEMEEAEQAGMTAPFVGADLPDWLSEASEKELGASDELASTLILSEENAMEAESPPAYPFTGDDIPEWLPEAEATGESQGSPEEPGQEDEIAPAQMPSWLQAMRPVEAVAPGKARPKKSTAAESAGPLAGLQGILPAEDLATQYRKPPIYSTKLQVSESQRAHADLLEGVLEQENQPKSIRSESLQTPKWIVRLIIAALLIGVLAMPMLFRPFSDPLALSYPAESVTSFHQQVELLAEEAPVLVAFDYDPGFSGEMRFAAKGVLEGLIAKRARIATVSTVAQGPVLGDDLLRTALEGVSASKPELTAEYRLGKQTINLGYLAGGLASLQEFAVRPKQAVQTGFDRDLGAELVWNDPVLQGVNQAGDFAMIVVITDDVDTARSWIEQVEPFSGSTPMLLITSAQASPMLLPYLQSGQVQGMLSGMSGGMAYEKLSGSSMQSVSYFNAYQYAMIMGVAFVLLGLVFKILTSMITHRKAKGEA